jgi:hypothetical protein
MGDHRDNLKWSKYGLPGDPEPAETLEGTVDDDNNPTMMTATGTCPFCLGPMIATKPLVVRGGGGDIVGQAAVVAAPYTLDRVFTCSCSFKHPKRPDETRTGCGRSVRVVVTVRP